MPQPLVQTPRIESIDIGPGRRPVNQAAVDSLAESIAAIGLQSPITVKFSGGRFALIAGRHRLEACRKLRWDRIPAFFSDMSERDARLWEISENLHRAELTAGERADQIAEWIRLTTDASDVSRQVDANPQGGRPEGGVRAAARELGISEPSARRAIRIASIAPEAREAAREAGLDDNQSALLRVTRAPREQQVAAVAEIVEARSAPDDPEDDLRRKCKEIIDGLRGEALSAVTRYLENCSEWVGDYSDPQEPSPPAEPVEEPSPRRGGRRDPDARRAYQRDLMRRRRAAAREAA
jgi:ParB-like chromosome segregation protein Spo0J